MLILHNPVHHLHAGRQEMFRGRLVPCHETPARLDHVMNEMGRRPLGRLREAGAARVAMVDVDYHHGNGTQSIVYERSDVFTVSIHGDPITEYPFYLGYADETGLGQGTGFNLNLPLPPGTGFADWHRTLQRALAEVRRYGAQALVVPLGVDTFEGDPISRFTLQSEDFFEVGRVLASAGLPTVFVMEGGYAVAEVGVNVVNVLEGFLGSHAATV